MRYRLLEAAWGAFRNPPKQTSGALAIGHVPVCRSDVHHGDGAMIIAMIAVGMMQMPIDQVVDVIAVGNRLVAAAGAVNMSRFVATAVVPRSTGSGIGFADGDRMLGHAAIFLMAKDPSCK